MTPLLFFFAFLIRLINLNQSLWLDESIVAKVAHTIPLLRIPFVLSPSDVHPPVYYMMISVWSSMFGTSEIALRMPSVIASLLAGWFVYRTGLILKDKATGLWASAFFLLNPLIIYYSQEARMHMMAAAFLSGALYYFVLIIKNTKKTEIKNIVLFNVFSVLAMSVFYGSAFFLVSTVLVWFFFTPRKTNWISAFARMTGGLLFALILLSPLLYLQMQNAQAGLADLKNWTAALGKAELKNVAMIFLKFATGRLSWYPKWSYYLIAGMPTAIIWIMVGWGGLKNKMLGLLFVVPLLLGLIVSFVAPMMMYFRFLYLVVVMSILLALFIATVQKKQIIGTAILFLYSAFSFLYLFNPQFHREDWKGLGSQLEKNIPVYMIIPSSDPIGYYRADVSVFELRSIQKSTVPEYVYVVPYTADLYGLDHNILLEKKGCLKESTTHFRGDLILEKWSCLKNA